jgi:hypothetical protein
MKEGSKEDKEIGKKEGRRREKRKKQNASIFIVLVFKLLLPVTEPRRRLLFIFERGCKIVCPEY